MKHTTNSASKHLSDRLHKACEETRRENRIRAAAPDLLEACKANLNILEFFLKRDPNDNLKQAYVDTRDAIAKAEGV